MKIQWKATRQASFTKDAPSRELVKALDLRPGSLVLEYFAGSGKYTLPIAGRLDDLDGDGIVFAVDDAGSGLKNLDKRAVRHDLDHRIRLLPLKRAPKGTVPMMSGAVDRLITVDTDLQSPEGSVAVREMGRVLKPEGVLVVGASRDTRFRDGVSPQVEAEYAAKVLGTAGFKRLKLMQPKGVAWAIAARKR